MADAPDLTLKGANKFLQDSIVLMRKLPQRIKFWSWKKANNKGAQATILTADEVVGLIYVNEQFDGWKAKCLRMLAPKQIRHQYA